MRHTKARLRLDESAIYEIHVCGHLDERWVDYVQGMEITTSYIESEGALTVLEGLLLDQAALVGVINFLYDHRLPLLSVECVSTQ